MVRVPISREQLLWARERPQHPRTGEAVSLGLTSPPGSQVPLSLGFSDFLPPWGHRGPDIHCGPDLSWLHSGVSLPRQRGRVSWVLEAEEPAAAALAAAISRKRRWSHRRSKSPSSGGGLEGDTARSRATDSASAQGLVWAPSSDARKWQKKEKAIDGSCKTRDDGLVLWDQPPQCERRRLNHTAVHSDRPAR